MAIIPVHKPKYQDLVDELAEDMKANGWKGNPLLGVRKSYGNKPKDIKLLTGAHRWAAAKAAGIKPPIKILEPVPYETFTDEEGKKWLKPDDTNSIRNIYWWALQRGQSGSDEGLKHDLNRLKEIGDIDQEILDLIEDEIATSIRHNRIEKEENDIINKALSSK